MPLIRVTQKLQKEIGLKFADPAVSEDACAPLEEWYAHVFVLNRKKQIVFVETQTLISFCIENVSRKDIRERLKELFDKGLGKALYVEGASGEVVSKVLEACRGQFVFTKAHNRRTIGAMNEIVKQHKFCFCYQDRSFEMEDRCNRHMPMRGYQDGAKDYKFPIDVFAKVVKDQYDLEFTPLKDVFDEKIYSAIEH